MLTSIGKPNRAEALECRVLSWDYELVTSVVGHGGSEMLVIDIVTSPDPWIHINQLVDDDVAITALWDRRPGRSIIVFLPNNAQAVLIVKCGAFATQGLVEVAID